MSDLIQSFSNWLWGPMLTLVLGTGLYLLVRLRAVQAREFVPPSSCCSPPRNGDGDITPFAALMTAVGGIVGNGNLAGVATAVTAGGPGRSSGCGSPASSAWARCSPNPSSACSTASATPTACSSVDRCTTYETVSGWPSLGAFFAFGLAIKTLLATTVVQSNSIASVVSSELAGTR